MIFSPWVSTAALRSSFLEFFHSHGHTIDSSASLIPHTDPSLLFTTAGMVPFKHYFTGVQTPLQRRVTTSQKCLRSGGKHNDLDEVGYTSRHHTFFEMLGNFSFGDYFKEEAIFYAWTFLTKTLNIPAEKLWITVYYTDHVARELWKKIGNLEDHRIISIDTLDNFWSAGDTGPCGPCSEIFYDHGDHLPGGLPGTPEEGGERFVEIWNLVFMEFESVLQDHGTIARIPLPRPCIDTGMGLERIAAVMQGTHDNFETDILKTLVEGSQKLTGCSKKSLEKSHRVLADHIRALCFLMADGLLPSNEGRGYVLRRILRRSLRHVHNIGGDQHHLSELANILYDLMGSTYPELLAAKDIINMTLQQEYQRFCHLLDRGMSLLSQWIIPGKTAILSGEKAFQLYDTYGFPLDMTLDIAREQKFIVDEVGFNKAMEAQRQQSRDNAQNNVAFGGKTLFSELGNTLKPTVFTGYTHLEAGGKILWIGQKNSQGDMESVEILSKDCQGYIVVDKTPFYAQGGGQVGDKGILRNIAGDVSGEVLNITKEGDLFFHEIHMVEGQVEKNQDIFLQVNDHHRRQVSVHHSATHLLQGALRDLLGPHVMQKGSLVTAQSLRFDFSHPEGLSWEQLETLENTINAIIRQNQEVCAKIMPFNEAMEEKAIGLFGEKYGQDVRVITMGEASKELCGGTHVGNLGEIGLFKIVSEGSIASGVRRIEALAGQAALQWVQDAQRYILGVASKIKTSPQQISVLLEKTLQALDKSGEKKKESLGLHLNSLLKKQGQCLWGVLPLCHGDEKYDGKILSGDLKKCLQKEGIPLGILIWPSDKSLSVLLVSIKEDTHSAKNLLSLFLGDGRGGGSPTMAQGQSTLTLEEISKKIHEDL